MSSSVQKTKIEYVIFDMDGEVHPSAWQRHKRSLICLVGFVRRADVGLLIDSERVYTDVTSRASLSCYV